MKKRKPPYLLASFLVVFIGVAVIMNPMSQSRRANEPEQPPQQEQPAAGESRKTESSQGIAARATDAFSSSKTAGGTDGPSGPGARPPMAPGGISDDLAGPTGPSGPKVVLPEANSMKPKPGDSSVSTQWYRENHAKQKGN